MRCMLDLKMQYKFNALASKLEKNQNYSKL